MRDADGYDMQRVLAGSQAQRDLESQGYVVSYRYTDAHRAGWVEMRSPPPVIPPNTTGG